MFGYVIEGDPDSLEEMLVLNVFHVDWKVTKVRDRHRFNHQGLVSKRLLG